MKSFITLTLLILGFSALHGQNIVSSNDPKLEVFFRKSDGTAAIMTCDRITVMYNQLRMSGEMELSALVTEDEDLRALIAAAAADCISFTTQLPEGQFVFHNTLNNQFNTELDLTFGDFRKRIILNGEVSNLKTTVGNTFLVIYSGLRLSLKEDLGIIQDLGLDDQFDFRMTHNVRVINY